MPCRDERANPLNRVCFLLAFMTAPGDERTFRFCPRCAGPFSTRILKPGDPARLVCNGCGFVFYLDPKVAVGTIIRTSDHEIVLCRRAIEPGYGRWVFPGGYVDRGEKLEEAAVREAREECGLDVELERLVSLHSYSGRTPVVIVYAARVVGGALTVADEESLEVRTFTAETIPWEDLAFDSTEEALRAYFGARDLGFGIRNAGIGTRDSGLETRDSQFGTPEKC
jgi:ADP-ribose pyrophosphatase YjhB (NUDIX family)